MHHTFLPPWPKLASHWHLSPPCNGTVASSLLASVLVAVVAAAVAVGTPGSLALAEVAAAASLLAAVPLTACAYTPTQNNNTTAWVHKDVWLKPSLACDF